MAEAEPLEVRLPPVLTGKKALVVGVANEHSIAWGCTQAMQCAGAEIALTYLNERTRQYIGHWQRRSMLRS
jgi:enoyl-[acyl-carrier-protein] reductase (NADH)